MSPSEPRDGVLRSESFAYRGKTYTVPIFDPADPVVLTARAPSIALPDTATSPVLRDLHSIWDLAKFREARRPVSLGVLSAS